MGFNPANYEDVDSRVHRFWEQHPQGSIQTEILRFATSKGERWTVRAEVYRNQDDPRPAGIGHADEIDGEGNVNRTSALENCETSAVGRALADAGFSPKGQRPSREEMEKANRSGTEQRASSPSPKAGRQAPSQLSKAKSPTSGGEPKAATSSRDDPSSNTRPASSPSSPEEVAGGGEVTEASSGDIKLLIEAIASKRVPQSDVLRKAAELAGKGVSRKELATLPAPVLSDLVDALSLRVNA